MLVWNQVPIILEISSSVLKLH